MGGAIPRDHARWGEAPGTTGRERKIPTARASSLAELGIVRGSPMPSTVGLMDRWWGHLQGVVRAIEGGWLKKGSGRLSLWFNHAPAV